MADRVIVSGVTRRGEDVETAELRQMAGRAGRVQGGATCYADFIIGCSERDEFIERYGDDESLTVASQMDADLLAFHLLPEIASGRVNSIAKAQEWYDRSLHKALGGSIDVAVVIDCLLDCEAIADVQGRYFSTILGDTCTNFYFHPATVACWKHNFEDLFSMNCEHSDYHVAYAVSDVPFQPYNAWHKTLTPLVSEVGSQFSYDMGTATAGALWLVTMGVESVSGVGGVKGQMKQDFGRMFPVFQALDKMCNWGMSDFFEELRDRIAYGVPRELVELIRLEGITKSHAMALEEIGVRNIDEILEGVDYVINNSSDVLIPIIKKLVVKHG